LLGDTRDAWAVNAEDARNVFLGQFQAAPATPILQHEKPCAKSFLDGVMGVAGYLLRNLSNVHLDVTLNKHIYPVKTSGFFSEYVTLDL